MTSEEQENFLRIAIIVVDHAKESFIELIDVHLINVGLTFEQFINQNQHEIFHLFNNARCCKCHTRNTSRNSRVIFAPQMSILFDKATQCNAGRCLDFCCCTANPGLSTKDLDMTLAKCLLINFCSEVFWYASLNFLGQTLEQFLNIHKHDIYHVWQNSVSCCECDPTTPTQTRRGFLNSLQWNHMFKSTSMPCANHRKRPASGTVNCICSMKSITGISLAQIDDYTQDVLIKQCCRIRKAIDSLTSIRNERYGHISEGRISNNEYHSLITEIERGIIEIAKVCKKERYFEAKLKMAKTQTLSMDYVTNEKYKQKMLEVLSNSVEIEMHLTNQDSTLEAIRGKAKRIPTEIVSKIPKIVDESTQHISRTVQENFAYQREMVEKYGNKLRQYCDLTLMDIKSHWSEGTFVETEEVRRCVSEIKENDVIIIYGRTGSGKTRTGLEILRQLGELDQSYHLVKILDIQQVNDVLMTGVNIALLLDDLFCFEFKSREGLVWNSVFDRLYSCKMNICIKIICTVKTSFKKSISQYFQSKRIFLNRFEIDLESASLSIH